MSFFGRLFGRKPEAPRIIDRREYNDWRVGDLAVCVCDDWIEERPEIPRPCVGDVNRVIEIRDGLGISGRVRCYYLDFGGDRYGYESRNFRKAVEDAEPAEADFTALIKRPFRAPGKVKA